MKKIPSLYMRNYDSNRLVRDEVVPGSEWVLRGEGTPTRKWDGTACMLRSEMLFKRFDRKRNKRGQLKDAPAGWEPCEPEADKQTGHWPGWVPVSNGSEDQWHREAFAYAMGQLQLTDGTYELIGPKVQGGAEGISRHELRRHGDCVLSVSPLDFKGIKLWLSRSDVEGIVWHHPDGRIVKIKARDFGLARRKVPVSVGSGDRGRS